MKDRVSGFAAGVGANRSARDQPFATGRKGKRPLAGVAPEPDAVAQARRRQAAGGGLPMS
jgi:hypothetical protein